MSMRTGQFVFVTGVSQLVQVGAGVGLGVDDPVGPDDVGDPV
jgi:hypothetical protein